MHLSEIATLYSTLNIKMYTHSQPLTFSPSNLISESTCNYICLSNRVVLVLLREQLEQKRGMGIVFIHVRVCFHTHSFVFAHEIHLSTGFSLHLTHYL